VVVGRDAHAPFPSAGPCRSRISPQSSPRRIPNNQVSSRHVAAGLAPPPPPLPPHTVCMCVRMGVCARVVVLGAVAAHRRHSRVLNFFFFFIIVYR